MSWITDCAVWEGVQDPTFTPPQIADCIGWYDAADTASITDAGGGAASQWNDKSGLGRHMKQSSGTNRPTTGSRTRNSLNVLDFDGSSDFMLADNFDIDLATGKEVTTVIVSEHDSSPTNAGMVVYKRAGSLDIYNLVLEAATGALQRVYGIGTTGAFSTANFDTRRHVAGSAGTSPLWIARATNGTPVDRLDGVNATPGDAGGGGTMTPSNWLSGGSGDHKLHFGHRVNQNDTDAGSYLNGALCEVIIYDRLLTDPECVLLETYLMGKWAIS